MSRDLKKVEFNSTTPNWSTNTDYILSYFVDNQSAIKWENNGSLVNDPLMYFYKSTSDTPTSHLSDSYIYIPSVDTSSLSITFIGSKKYNSARSKWEVILNQYFLPDGFELYTIDGISYHKWIHYNVSGVTGIIMYTPASWGIISNKIPAQVESAVCDEYGWEISNTFVLRDDSAEFAESGSYKIKTVARTGEWSDVIGRPIIYRHDVTFFDYGDTRRVYFVFYSTKQNFEDSFDEDAATATPVRLSCELTQIQSDDVFDDMITSIRVDNHGYWEITVYNNSGFNRNDYTCIDSITALTA